MLSNAEAVGPTRAAAFVFIATFAWAGAAEAQYTQRFTTVSGGALTFTGNSLGLDGETSQNGQGTRGAIGTFIATDTSQRDVTPPPTTAPLFPFGTTSDWRLNGSQAVLRLPAGSRVVHAELVWGGTFAGPDSNVSAFINDPVVFTTPAGTFEITPDPATAKSSGTPAASGTCNACFYVRTANVTSQVAAGGAGTYRTGRVPATQGVANNNNASGGWTLAVVYEDFTQPVRSLSLLLGLQGAGPAASVSGFCTPQAGQPAGRLAISAIEGDARVTGDKVLFGGGPLSNSDRLEGPRNPRDNFFSSQITRDDGSLDTAGTFGDRNHTPGTPSIGARQGWDVANIDLSRRLRKGATSALVQGVTDGDTFQIIALGLQVDANVPQFASAGALSVDRATAAIGDVLTYTVLIDNSRGEVDATNVVFFDTLPAGTSFVAGSFTVNGVVQPGANPGTGVPLGTVAAGGIVTVRLQARVDTIPAGPNGNLLTNRARWTFDFASCDQAAQQGIVETNNVLTIVAAADLRVTKSLLTQAVAGAIVTYQVVVQNAGPGSVSGAVVTDSGSTPALTNMTWTCVPPAAGAGSCVPASGTGALSSTVALAAQATVSFRVTGTLPATTPAGTLGNTATVTPSAGVPDPNTGNNTASASAPILRRADLEVLMTGPASASLGGNLVYTIVVTNRGPSDADNVLLTDPAPPGLTLVSLDGPCTVAPGCSLPAGASGTITATFAIPPDYAGPDPIVNVANVASSISDPNIANNTSRSTTSLNAPIADVAITETDNVTEITAGSATTFTITVTNDGPASAADTRVVDTFEPAAFGAVQWQCVASGSSTCSVSGVQTGDIDTLVTIDPGPANAIVFTVNAQVRPDAIGSVENTSTATVAPGITDPVSGNNVATDVDTVTTVADISIVKTGPPVIVPGTTADYVIVVANGGPSTVRNILFSELPLDGTTLLDGIPRPELVQRIQPPAGSSCDAFTPSGATVAPVCTISSLAPGATSTFNVRLAIPSDYQSVQASSAPPLTNAAVFQAADLDSDPDDDDLVGLATAPLTPQADLAVTKVGPAATVTGGIVSYFLRVSNLGPSGARNIVLDDLIPAGLTLVDGSTPCGTAFPCPITSLAPGESVETRIDLLVPVDYAGPPTFANTATVTAATADPDTSNNSATAVTAEVPDQADLEVTLAGRLSIAPGGRIDYLGRVTNLGPGPAINVESSAVIPGGATFEGGAIPPAPTACALPTPGVSNLVSCVTPVLQAGEFIEFRFSVLVSSELPPGSLLTTLGAASSPTPDFNSSNDQAELITEVAAPIDAGVSVEIRSASHVAAGTAAAYTITVRNAGPAAATGTTLTATLPPELTFQSAAPSQGTCTVTTCSLGTLAPATAATVTLTAVTTVPGVFTTTASATAAEHDPVLTNNTADARTTVATPEEADLLIEKSGPTIIAPGHTSFYSIRVTNLGPAPALDVEVDDALPAGITFLGNAGACVTAFPCLFEALQPGQSVVIATVFEVSAAVPTPGTAVNTTTVSSFSTPGPDPSNNSSSLTTEIESSTSADLVVQKRDSPDAVIAGTSLSYAITVANRGPAAASGVVVTDVLPAGVSLTSATPTLGTCGGGPTITCNVGTMPPGSIVEIGILATAPTDVPSPNPMINTVSATSSAVDPSPADNQATAATTVLPPSADLAVTNVITTPAIPGLAASYAIVVTNGGPSAVVNASVLDAVPPEFVPVSWTCAASAGSTCGASSGAGVLSSTVNLAADGTATFIVTGTIASGATGALVNTATVAVPAGVADPGTTNNVAVSSVTLTPSADLRVSKSGSVQATPGGSVSYTITVTNAGPSDAATITLTDPTPPGLSFVAGGGACVTYPCALGALVAGGTVVATATFAVPAGYTTPDPIVNTVTVSSATTPDPAAANNSATATSAIAAPVTDLGLTKTNGVSTIVPGTTTTYTIVVTNAGPSNATGATVTDVFPAALTGVTWTCATPSGGSCAAPAGSGSINTTVTLPVGASAIFTATATVAPDAVGVLVNTAAVAPGPGASDPSSANNTDTDTLTPRADLVITKTGPATAVPGSALVYTITVRNDGPSNAERVVVADPTPAGLEFTSNTGDCTTPFPCDLGTVSAGASRTITATFDLPVGTTVVSPIVNLVDVSSTTPEIDASTNSARLETTLNLDADVELSKAVAPGNVQVGDTVVVTVKALNRGPNRATGVEVTDNLPGGFALTSATATHGAYDAATGKWTIGDVAADATARLDVTATVTGPGSITNLAVKTGQNEPDPNTANDSAAATTNAVPAADLVVNKTVGTSEPLVGETVTFTVRVTNRGPSPATGVAIQETLPGGVTLQSAAPSHGTYDAASGLWTIGPLGVLDEAVLTVSAVVAAPGVSSNNAVIAARDQVDPNPLNDSAAASINAAPNADLRVAKAASNLAPAVGGDVTYTIAVTNLGPSAATTAEILDLLPAGLTFVSATASQGTYDQVSGIWTLGAMPVTATETLSLTARVTQPGSIANSASRASSAPIDPNPANDGAATSSTPVTVADLAVTKTSAVGTVIAGQPLTWTVVVINHGPSAIAGAQVADAFVPAFGNIQWMCSASAGAVCAVSSGTSGINTTVDLPQGGTATFVATGVTDPGTTGVLDSVATVAIPAPASDPDPANNTDSAPVQIGAVSDLEVMFTGSPAQPVSPGTTIVYTATVVNRGPSAAASVALTATTPADLVLASVGGACTGLPCALAGIVPGQSPVVAISYAVPLSYPGPGPIVATVTATSASDANVADNTATVTTVVAMLADLTIVNAGPSTAVPGGTVTYELTVTNTGRGAAAAVTIDDPAPSGLSFVSASAPCAGGFPCAIGSLAPGAAVSVTVTFRLPRTPTSGTIVNRATVISSTGETTTANNAATAVARIARAGCDVNGDGIDELVTGAGPGGGPHVVVFDVATAQPVALASFYAYDPAFGGGVFVACGDVDGDGRADAVTGAGPGGGPHVRAFSFPVSGGIVEIAGFLAYDPAFAGGVRVAAADVDGDGIAEIITGAGRGGGPHVRVIKVAGATPIEFASFFAYEPVFGGGVLVAGGDVTGDGRAEIITGTYRDGGPVRVFSLDTAGVSERLHFFPYFPAFVGEVRVAAGDVTGDGLAEIITGAGPGGGPHVVVWSSGPGAPTPLASFYAYDPTFCDIGTILPDPQVCDGVFVGAGDIDGDGADEVITGTNRQGGPLRVFQIGAGVIERLSFYPYFEAFRGPVHVAAGMNHRDLPAVFSGGLRRSQLLSRNRPGWHAPALTVPADLKVRTTLNAIVPADLKVGTTYARGRSPPGPSRIDLLATMLSQPHTRRMAARDVVVIGASAGGVTVIQRLLSSLPSDFRGVVFVAIHRPPQLDTPDFLPRVLAYKSSLRPRPAVDGQRFTHGEIYVAPPNSHLLVERGVIRLERSPGASVRWESGRPVLPRA